MRTRVALVTVGIAAAFPAAALATEWQPHAHARCVAECKEGYQNAPANYSVTPEQANAEKRQWLEDCINRCPDG